MRFTFVTSQALSRHATIKRAWGVAPHLLERGWSVSIVAEDCAENRAAVEAIPGLEARYYPAGLSVFAERRAKEDGLRSLRPEVTQVCGLGWRNAVNAARVPGRVLMDHVELESALPGTSRLRRRLQAGLERWSFRHYAGTVAASRYLEFAVRMSLFGRGLWRPVLWLPFAFEPAAFRPDPADVAARRAGAMGRRTLAYMGGLYANYGVRELIAAYRSSAELNRTARLVFVGQGPEADYVRRHSCRSPEGPWIEYAGFLDEADLPAFLFSCDVLVSPLRDTVQDWARCPSKTYLYMATGRPIVTAAVGENREALGDLGFYYRSGDQASMTEALSRAAAVAGGVPYGLETHTWAHRTGQLLHWLAEEFGVALPGSGPRALGRVELEGRPR